MKIPLTRTLVPSRATRVAIQQQGDVFTVFSFENEGFTRLNSSAVFFWQLCDGKTPLSSIAENIDQERTGSISTCADMVAISDTLRSLHRRGLVKLTSQQVNPIVRVCFDGVPDFFDTLRNFFTCIMSRWVDLLVVDVGEQVDLRFMFEGAGCSKQEPDGSLRILVDADGVCDHEQFDLVFSTGITPDSGKPNLIRLPEDYLHNIDVELDAVSEKNLRTVFVADDSAPSPTTERIPDKPKILTIGMATYDDYDGVYFSVQAIRMYHPEVTNDTEILVIDNNPSGPCAEALENLGSTVKNYRYIPNDSIKGTAVRDFVFHEAQTEFVMCIDSHVFIEPGAIRKLLDYYERNPDSPDLLQGPLVYDDLNSISTHFEPVWNNGMFGVWGTDDRGRQPDAEPFEIPMQGLGLATCRKDAWMGYNPRFHGFGGEEGYIHQKFRNAGAKTLCLPFLRWMHRFTRPMGTRYDNIWEHRIRNYLIGFEEVGLDTDEVASYFTGHLNADIVSSVTSTLSLENRMRVSVVTPTFNREKFLPRLLASFLLQTWNNKELLILNDDRNVFLSCDYDNVVIYNIKERMKLGAKRNFLVGKATGSIIAPHDDDDVFLPGRLENQIRQYADNPEIEYLANRSMYVLYGDRFLLAERGAPNCCSFRKSTWEKTGGYPEDLNAGEDQEFQNKNRIFWSDESDYIYQFGHLNFHSSHHSFEEIGEMVESRGDEIREIKIVPDFESVNNLIEIQQYSERRNNPGVEVECDAHGVLVEFAE